MSKRKWRQNHILLRLLIWLIFDVIVSLTPFVFGYLQAIDRDEAFHFSDVLGSGQLLLVAVAIAASAIGELIAIEVTDMQKVPKVLALGLAFLVVIVSALWFGDITASISGNSIPDEKTVSVGSVLIYLWTLCASAWCLTLAESQADLRAQPAKSDTDEGGLLTQNDEEI